MSQPHEKGSTNEDGEIISIDVDRLAEQEAKIRPEKIKRLSAKVMELFPGDELIEFRRDIIERSFNVPQFGDYHNEGLFMDSHLDLILKSIDQVEEGQFPNEVSKDLQATMQDVVKNNKEALERYVFLHDISKADCLTIKYKDKKEEVTWEEWQDQLPDEAKTDPVKLNEYCKEQGITGIAYYQKKRKHGEVGANQLEAMNDILGISDIEITAIAKHEVAYQFGKINIKAYKKHFGQLSLEERAWVITASYIDTSASLRKDGKPILENFIAMTDTIHNHDLINDIEANLKPDGNLLNGLDSKKVEKALKELRDSSKRITENQSELLIKLKESCKVSHYDRDKFRHSLDALVASEQINAELVDQLIETIDDEGLINDVKLRGLRKKLGKANRIVNSALEDSII